MDAHNKLFLDTNRHHLQKIKNGNIKNLQTRKMLSVMKEEFNPNYENIDEWDFDSVAKLIIEVYRHYDEYIINLEKIQS